MLSLEQKSMERWALLHCFNKKNPNSRNKIIRKATAGAF